MKRSVEQLPGDVSGQPVTTYVFKQNGEASLAVSMPEEETFRAEIENWLHGDGSAVALLRAKIEEPFGPAGMLSPALWRQCCGDLSSQPYQG